MKIVVAVRCYNEQTNIKRFMRGYDFADIVLVSDGGSTDNSVSMLKTYDKVKLIHFKEQETINEQTWNLDNPHINFLLDVAKDLSPDILFFDDMDCVPNLLLRSGIKEVINTLSKPQLNVFRVYMWGSNQYFPKMNNNFDPAFTSLWAWKPKEIDIHADESIRHGTLVGLTSDCHSIDTPMCLMHKSWNPDTIQKKINRYNELGLPMEHPLSFAGEPKPLEDWMKE